MKLQNNLAELPTGFKEAGTEKLGKVKKRLKLLYIF